MPDDSAKRRPARIGELAGQILLGLGLTQTDLDQLVALESLVERSQQGLAEPALADEDDRPDGMREAAKMPPLGAVEVGRRGALRFSGFGGHDRKA